MSWHNRVHLRMFFIALACFVGLGLAYSAVGVVKERYIPTVLWDGGYWLTVDSDPLEVAE